VTTPRCLLLALALVVGCTGTSNDHDGAPPDAGPADLCLATGGQIETRLCCTTTGDYPGLCAVGACGCAPENSHDVSACICPGLTCFLPDRGCVLP
jgi:hypothetical protein